MQNRRDKQGIALLAAFSLAGIVLLAAALGSFSFASPYQLLSENCSTSTSSRLLSENCTNPSAVMSSAAMLRIFVALLLVLVPLIAYLLVTAPHYRRWLLLIFALLFLIVYAIIASHPASLLPEEVASVGGTVGSVQAEVGTPQPTLAPSLALGTAQVTPGLVWLLSLGLAGLVLTLAAAVYMSVSAYRTRMASPLEIIAATAETALQALEQGSYVRGVILRCYSAMLAAASELGVDRPGQLTPAEFIQRLVHAGLPPGAVERLTHLFEAVRYSPQPPTAVMEAEAVDCLQVVVQAAKGNI
jgi:hypothetical protein